MIQKEKSVSLWQELGVPRFPELSTNIQADVCVIGAGIAGISVAHTLAHEGLSVVVLEKDTLGSGQTRRTTAHLTNAMDDRFYKLLRLYGKQKTSLVAESHTAAISYVETVVNNEAVSCDFERVPGYLFIGKEHTRKILTKEWDAIREIDVPGVNYSEATPKLHPQMRDLGPSLHFSSQAQFHPMKYLAGLARCLTGQKGKIFNNAAVMEVKATSHTSVEVKTRNGVTVQAGSVVVATNTPINDRVVMHTKQFPYRTYVLGFEMEKNSMTPALLWDTSDPYHYVRVARGETKDYLIVGGEDHRTGQTHDYQTPYRKLERWARWYFPFAREIVYQWSGQVMEPMDSLAYIGRNPADSPNVYIATGDSGQGMTHGTIAGILIKDLILGRPNAWQAIYEPSRIKLKSVNTYLTENAKSVFRYKDWVTPGEVDSVHAIDNGSGAILREGTQKLAVYRDMRGKLHKRSAVCPHLKGIVAWNEAERTWDCPVHGSRFNCYGRVIEGPAYSDLNPEKSKIPPRQIPIEEEPGQIGLTRFPKEASEGTVATP